jgi:hypothetical protein
MLYRAHRSAVLVRLTQVALIVGISLPGLAFNTQASGQSIRFKDLEACARSESPRARILMQELLKVQAERDNALQWTNPEFAYDHEELEPSREWQVTLRKSFVMPFAHSEKREGWAQRVHAGELQLDQNVAGFLADLKTGYIRVKLLDAYLARLTQLGKVVTKASQAAEARYSEGEMSGIDKHLIQLSVLALDASRRDSFKERQEAAARLYAEIGIPAHDTAVLVTRIAYKAVKLASLEEYTAMLEQRPAIQSLTALQRALGMQARSERPSLVPGFELYAGYKHIDPEADGWVAGAALTLPFFDRKAGTARRLEAERRITKNELELYRTRSSGEIATLVHLIEDAGRAMSQITFHPSDDEPVIGSLFHSYQEGRYTLEAFLNAIQIELTGSRAYYDQLITYYESIFRLEAFTGTRIVSFSSEESEIR